MNYTGLYLHQRFSVIKKKKKKIKKQIFFPMMYIFKQLLAIFSESAVDVEICSLIFGCFSLHWVVSSSLVLNNI